MRERILAAALALAAVLAFRAALERAMGAAGSVAAERDRLAAFAAESRVRTCLAQRLRCDPACGFSGDISGARVAARVDDADPGCAISIWMGD